MILLDTNVVSEAMKPDPHPAVQAWLDAQAAQTLFLSSVTVAELSFGVGALAKGKRRDLLSAALEGVLRHFEGRVLPFDLAAAQSFGELSVRARIAGRGFPMPDGSIAAIAAARRFSLATRDASAFEAAGLVVIDPWSSAAR